MFVILFYANLTPFLGEGPLWYGIQKKTPCHDYWWTNLLYINNFYPKTLVKEVGRSALQRNVRTNYAMRSFVIMVSSSSWPSECIL